MKNDQADPVVEAIHDLTRVMLAMNDGFGNKSETVRKLNEIGIDTARISAIMGMPSKDISSILAKAVKKGETKDG